MNRPRYKRTPAQTDGETAVEVPVVLPLVVMTIHHDATTTVTIDDMPHEPPPFAAPWRRDSFAAILGGMTRHRRCRVRVEICEADGTVFTDITTHGDAAPGGTAPALLAAQSLTLSPTREVILLGRVSGTFAVGHPQ